MPTLARAAPSTTRCWRFRWRRSAARSPASRCRCGGSGGGSDSALDVVVVAGALALAATFALHVAYSYGRHLATGWLMDAYPRYYLPLAAIVPLAGLSLVAAIEQPRWRAALLAFLMAGPDLFRLLGAPLG